MPESGAADILPVLPPYTGETPVPSIPLFQGEFARLAVSASE